MKESIAFWYEPVPKATSQPPDVELHFNLWRDLFVPDTNFFDVGIKFLGSDDGRVLSKAVSSFSLFIPGRFQKEQCLDLSPIMHQGQTLNAVFNDVVTITAERERDFEVAIGTAEKLTFHRVSVADEIDIEHIQMDANDAGTIFKFSAQFCQRLNQSTNHYLRIRFKLDKTTRALFFSDSKPTEWFLLPSFVRTELTEFRWNERRSFPTAITNRPLSFFRIVTVHYFLVRDVKFELISAHTDFRKIRRLEDHLWRHYLHGTLPNANPDWRIERAVARGMAREMVIYHWRVRSSGPEDQPIDDFIAFAKFRVPIPNLLIYAIVIACLGGAGNALYGIASAFAPLLRFVWSQPQASETLKPIENVVVAVVLMLLAGIIAYIATRTMSLVYWTTDKVLGIVYFIKRKLRW